MDMNKVILIGRLASDPELKYTPAGVPVASARIAVNRPMGAEARANGHEKQCDFIPLVLWRQTAEYASNYLSKGRLVSVEGRLQERQYEKDGVRRRDTEVVVEHIKSLERAPEGDGVYRNRQPFQQAENSARKPDYDVNSDPFEDN